MGLLAVLTQEGVYAELGKQSNLQTLCLLVGMMFLAHYYDREGLLQLVALKIFDRDAKGRGRPFARVLWKACLLSAALSAVVTNDATCVVVTPLLLKEHARQGRSRGELLPLLLGVATSANIGSAATYFGNPQNAFIAASSQDHISLVLFFQAALPAALLGMVLSVGLLYACYYRILFLSSSSSSSSSPSSPVHHRHCPWKRWGRGRHSGEGAAVVNYSELREEEEEVEESGVKDSSLTRPDPSVLHDDGGGGNSDRCSGDLTLVPPPSSGHHTGDSPTDTPPSLGHLTTDTPIDTPPVDQSLAAEGFAPTAASDHSPTHWFKQLTWRRAVFVGWLGLGTLALVSMLAVPPTVASFNSGLVPLAIAIATMLADSVLNRKHAYEAMVKIDWTVILLFSGLFVWLEGFQVTCLPSRAFAAARGAMDVCSVHGVLLFTLFVAVGSNLLSNVPLVVLMARFLPDFECPAHPGLSGSDVAFRVRVAGMVLAWVSTIAGNFTLIGSVANLIVAEKALKEAGFRLNFWQYVRFGAASTLVVTLCGLPVVYFVAAVTS